MEIKNVEEEPKKEYPTQDEVSNTKLKKSIPKKWKVLGISVLAVLLIGFGSIGFMIYKSATTQLAGSVISTMSIQEKQRFNDEFVAYEGNIIGSSVKTLISTVISHNRQMEVEDTPEKCVSIKSENQVYKDYSQLDELRNTIKSGAKYKVSASINDKTSLINEMTIEKINNN